MNCSSASKPPADAPMPMIGNETAACGADDSSLTAATGFLTRLAGDGFLFMFLQADHRSGHDASIRNPRRHRLHDVRP
jgi:hypothetical protein